MPDAPGEVATGRFWGMPQPTPALLDDAILLHIGPHKTGTTAIQGILAAARQELFQHGVTYPGRYGAQHLQARALRRHAAGWANDTEDLPDEKVWDGFARSVRKNPGRVVISSEFFAQSDASERARVVADLDPGRLHILIAARNPGSIALSTWQQILRDGKAGHLSDWLEKAFKRSTPISATGGFWSWADTATLVELWSQVLPMDRIRVVVIDEEDRALLPSTFEQLLDLPDGMLSTRQPRSSNRGLTAPEAEFLREVIALNRNRLLGPVRTHDPLRRRGRDAPGTRSGTRRAAQRPSRLGSGPGENRGRVHHRSPTGIRRCGHG